ncbi:CobW family GTP-binding protein [Rhizobium halophytocola]|uniref:G3E family GTPase n=1 Tax=Rhizobium halophytocola TaxID=735519 RepID=A0ABS4E2N6_9HYPH|nr:GTP-binding protein [Rhizobium halophytocola]MBP1852203.1 G3E family GTPase [Rhizobium halophytocola]
MAGLNDRVAVSILTGFLGAGKSTLLNRVLKDPAMKDAAIIINEFGEVGIDHLLVTAADEQMVELADGCLCCTVRGALVDTLAMIADAMQTGGIRPLSRIVIETTGLADPAPVMQSVIGNPVIAQNFEIEGMVTVVDAINALQTIERYPEAMKQVAVADRLVLSKLSLADDETAERLRTRLRALNPRAQIIDGDAPEAGSAALFATGLYDPATKLPDVARWLHSEAEADTHHHDHHHGHEGHHHHHDVNRHGHTIRSYAITHDQPIERMAIEMFVDLLRSTHGDKILRMKAIVALADDPNRPLVLHGVQSIFHRPERLPAWPDGASRETRLVLITDGLAESYVRELFDAFVGKPAPDRPDRQALESNPLAVPGMRF